MGDTRIYQLDWSGRGSNILTAIICAFFILVILWCSRNLFCALRELRKSPKPKAKWGIVATTILSAIGVIFWAVLAGVGGGAGSSGLSSGINSGYAANLKPSTARTLGISILAIIVLGAFVISATFFEQPLQLAVSPRQVELLYRLPWRDRTIPIEEIVSVDLLRYHDRRHNSDYYNLIIRHDRETTRILGPTAPSYNAQMKDAYEVIQARLRLLHEGAAIPFTSTTTKPIGRGR